MAKKIEDMLASLTRLQETTTDSKAKKPLQKVQTDLKAYLQERETERNRLLAAVNQNLATTTELQATTARLQAAHAEQLRVIEEMKKKLAEVPPPSTSTPLNVASSFKAVMDAIQAEARKTPGVATTVKAMDIEVKGLVQVQEDKGTVLVFPNIQSPIEANALSTLRVSFGAVPVIAPPPETEVRKEPPSPSPSEGPTPTRLRRRPKKHA